MKFLKNVLVLGLVVSALVGCNKEEDKQQAAYSPNNGACGNLPSQYCVPYNSQMYPYSPYGQQSQYGYGGSQYGYYNNGYYVPNYQQQNIPWGCPAGYQPGDVRWIVPGGQIACVRIDSFQNSYLNNQYLPYYQQNYNWGGYLGGNYGTGYGPVMMCVVGSQWGQQGSCINGRPCVATNWASGIGYCANY